MSKNKKNVNEEVVEEVKTEETVETIEEVVETDKKKGRKINLKAVGKGAIKIAAGVGILAVGAILVLVAAGGGFEDTSVKIDTNDDGSFTVSDATASADDDSDKKDE